MKKKKVYTHEEIRKHLDVGTWTVGTITQMVHQLLNESEELGTKAANYKTSARLWNDTAKFVLRFADETQPAMRVDQSHEAFRTLVKRAIDSDRKLGVNLGEGE